MEIDDNTTTTTTTKSNTNTKNSNFNVLLKEKNVFRRIKFVNRAIFPGVSYVNKWDNY